MQNGLKKPLSKDHLTQKGHNPLRTTILQYFTYDYAVYLHLIGGHLAFKFVKSYK